MSSLDDEVPETISFPDDLLEHDKVVLTEPQQVVHGISSQIDPVVDHRSVCMLNDRSNPLNSLHPADCRAALVFFEPFGYAMPKSAFLAINYGLSRTPNPATLKLGLGRDEVLAEYSVYRTDVVLPVTVMIVKPHQRRQPRRIIAHCSFPPRLPASAAC